MSLREKFGASIIIAIVIAFGIFIFYYFGEITGALPVLQVADESEIIPGVGHQLFVIFLYVFSISLVLTFIILAAMVPQKKTRRIEAFLLNEQTGEALRVYGLQCDFIDKTSGTRVFGSEVVEIISCEAIDIDAVPLEYVPTEL